MAAIDDHQTKDRAKDNDIEGFNALVRADELDMALQEELEIHICLKCSATVVGLRNYVLHKLRECPKLLNNNGDSTKTKETAVTASSLPHYSREPSQSRAKRRIPEDDAPEACDFVLPVSDSLKQGKRIKKECDNFQASCSESCLPSVPSTNIPRCDPCSITFDTKQELMLHLVSPKHWSLSKDHPLYKSLILGYADALAPLAPYKCAICSFYFNHLKELLDHLVKEKEAHVKKMGLYRKFGCNFCEYQCWNNEALLKHLNNAAHKRGVSCINPVIVSSTSEICCSKCEWTCGREQALFAHMKWKHSSSSPAKTSAVKQKFLIPAKENSANVEVARGIAKVSNKWASSGSASGKSEDPSKGSDMVSLRPTQNSLNLDESDALSSKKNSRKRRMKKKINSNNEENLENSQEESLNIPDAEVEMKTEGEEKSLEGNDVKISNKKLKEQKKQNAKQLCQYCDKIFGFKKQLEKHLVEFHPEKAIRCEPCCKTFVSENLLKLHEKTWLHRCTTKDMIDIEKGILKPTEEYPCSHCLFRTATKAGLMFHEIMHNIKPAKLNDNNGCSDACDLEKKAAEDEDQECAAVTDGGIENVVPSNELSLSSEKIKKEHIVGTEGEIVEQELGVKSYKESEAGKQTEINTLKEAEVPESGTKIVKEITLTDKSTGLKEDTVGVEVLITDGKMDETVEEAANTKGKIGKLRLYNCPVCNTPFPLIQLRNHLPTHTGELPFRCSYCSEAFAKISSLHSHLRSQHKDKKFACPHCRFRGKSRLKLESHLGTHKEERLRECLCEVCGAAFYNSAGIQAHMRIHKENKGRKYPCTYEGCNKTFRSPSEVLIHSSKHSNKVPFLCETCGVATKTKKLLKRHEKVHLQDKKHQCQYCSYSSVHAYHLQRHMRVHCLVKPYSCPYCSFTCNLSDNLRKHILKSKRHEGLRVYPCKHCSFSCDLAEGMLHHTMREHPEIAKLYDVDDPTFAMLVTKILNVEVDKRVPTEPPPPYIPRCEKRNPKNNLSVIPVDAPEGEAIAVEERVEIIGVEQIDENCEMLEALDNLIESTNVKRKLKLKRAPGKRVRKKAAEKRTATLIENDNPDDEDSQLYTMFQDSVLVVIQTEEVPDVEQEVII